MKKCYKCNVSVNTSYSKCPLCNNLLTGDNEKTDVFPIIPTVYKKHNLFIKIINFSLLFSSAFCLFLNYIISNKISWAWFVLIGIMFFWLALTTAIKRKNKLIKVIFREGLLISLIALYWDYTTGWYLWSITYVIPFMCISYTLTILVIRIFLQQKIKKDIINLYINCLIGFTPIIFVLLKSITIKWPSIISVFSSVCVFLLLIVFNQRQMKTELKKRFHI